MFLSFLEVKVRLIVLKEAKKLAQQIGLPVIVKAGAGGGGRGMRVVEKMEDLEKIFSSG